MSQIDKCPECGSRDIEIGSLWNFGPHMVSYIKGRLSRAKTVNAIACKNCGRVTLQLKQP